jgi:hypothetical protein
MNPTLFEIGAAIVMVTVGIALIAWFATDLAAASARRMMTMMARAGVAGHGGTEGIMREARRRCRGCRSEELCDRWLAGKVEGDNGFCPNAQVFRRMS